MRQDETTGSRVYVASQRGISKSVKPLYPVSVYVSMLSEMYFDINIDNRHNTIVEKHQDESPSFKRSMWYVNGKYSLSSSLPTFNTYSQPLIYFITLWNITFCSKIIKKSLKFEFFAKKHFLTKFHVKSLLVPFYIKKYDEF